jgi:GNAT superfamily N-acetyltransferase
LDQILLIKQDQVIAGFITWEKEIPKDTLPYIESNERDKIFIKSIVTDSVFQKRGIATQLVNTIIENHPDHHLVLLGWKSSGHCNIQKLCIALGFRCSGEIIDVWKNECESGAFDCPAYNCKCSCTALVFEK